MRSLRSSFRGHLKKKTVSLPVPCIIIYSVVSYGTFNIFNFNLLVIINFLISASKPMTSVNIATHVINSFYVILNISVTGMPKRILHVWFSVIFGMIYALFTVFYYWAGGTNHNGNPYVYTVLDWRKPGSAILYCALVFFVFVPVTHLILYGIHRLKVFIYEKCDCCKRQSGYQRVEM